MFPKCLNSSFTLYFHSQGFTLPPPAKHSGDPKQCAKIPFYCPGNGVVWGFRLFRCIPSKILSSAEIVVRWKAGPLLLLLQTKAEILMDFDFPDTSLGLDWYKQPKFTLRSVCLFVGCLFVLVWFGLGFFVCKPSHEQCLCYQHWIPTCLFLRISALKISGQKNSLGVIVPAVGQEFGMPICDVLVDAAHKELGMVMVFEFITELLWQWPSYSYLWIISFLSSVCSLFNQNKSHPTNTCLGPEIKYRQMIWFLGKHRMTGAALRSPPAAWREWQEHSTWNDSSARGF